MNDHLPKESVGDDLHRGARAALSAIPFVGGAAVELFNRVLAPPIQRRRDAWLNVLAERIAKMEQEGRINVEELQNNDEFVSTVMQASQVAIRNHQQEKLDALRNAVLNTAIGQSPDDSKREMFLGLVDVFTVWHLRILSLLADPPGWFQRHDKPVPQFAFSSSLEQVIKAALQEIASQKEFLELVMRDLDDRKLANSGGLMTMMTPQGALQKRTTTLGDEFLHFISKPKGDK